MLEERSASGLLKRFQFEEACRSLQGSRKFAAWFVLPCFLGLATPSTSSADSKSSATIFPRALTGETRKLEFHVSTPSGSSSLEVQTRASLKKLFQRNRDATILKLRVFAVGPYDLILVQKVVHDTFAARKRPFPVLSLIGVAAFPEPGQRVEIESVAVGKKQVNPYGVGFLAGVESPRGDQAISGLARVIGESGIAMLNVTRVSCFYESSEQAMAAKTAASETFPAAESSFVLSFAADAKPVIECEAVARLSSTISEGVRYFDLPGAKASPYFSRAALISAPMLIFTGAEMALGNSEPEVRDPFERAKKDVEQLGGKLTDVVMGQYYWLTGLARDRNREVRADYFGQTVPAATGLFFAGLSSPKATGAIELVVAVTEHGDPNHRQSGR